MSVAAGFVPAAQAGASGDPTGPRPFPLYLQSMPQLVLLSIPPQVPSPQQEGWVGTLVHR
jgi:hypothetical protein